jgi:hypothetical protein
MDLKAGTRLASIVCATELIVVRPPTGTVDLRCGGRPMVTTDCTERADESIDGSHRTGTQLGKRYADSETGLEVLCTKAGEGSLSLGDVAIPIKDPKPLPASD